jgi:hypothetical protein
MPNPIQWSLEQFYNELTRLNTAAQRVNGDLEADRVTLMKLWDSTFFRTQAQVGPPLYSDVADRQRLVQAQIHQNSTLRVMYNDIHGKLVDAVNKASAFLRSHGYQVPNLAGLGLVVAIAPLAAVAILVGVAGLVTTAVVLTEAQRKRTAAIQALWANTTIPTSEKLALIEAATKDEKAAAGANPLDIGKLVPVLGLVALLMFSPTILSFIPKGRGATA